MFSLPHSQVKERQSSWHEEHYGERLKLPTDLEMKVSVKNLPESVTTDVIKP